MFIWSHDQALIFRNPCLHSSVPLTSCYLSKHITMHALFMDNLIGNFKRNYQNCSPIFTYLRRGKLALKKLKTSCNIMVLSTLSELSKLSKAKTLSLSIKKKRNSGLGQCIISLSINWLKCSSFVPPNSKQFSRP